MERAWPVRLVIQLRMMRDSIINELSYEIKLLLSEHDLNG